MKEIPQQIKLDIQDIGSGTRWPFRVLAGILFLICAIILHDLFLVLRSLIADNICHVGIFESSTNFIQFFALGTAFLFFLFIILGALFVVLPSAYTILLLIKIYPMAISRSELGISLLLSAPVYVYLYKNYMCLDAPLLLQMVYGLGLLAFWIILSKLTKNLKIRFRTK